VTPRLVGYTVVLLALGVLFFFLLFTRSDVQTTILRAQAPSSKDARRPFQQPLHRPRGYKTSREIPIELKLENSAGSLQVMGQPLVAPPQKSAETSVLIELEPSA